MKDTDFIRRTRRYARKAGLMFRHDVRRGKGSHQRVEVGTKLTTVPQGELKPMLVAKMLKDLGIDRKDW